MPRVGSLLELFVIALYLEKVFERNPSHRTLETNISLYHDHLES
ncbi:hypothetical protein VCRA219O19_20374 [Vibrio crassostreae]|nr:hypothetical protein VCRA219O19_20374 [Vibrio crassostreae]